MPPRPPGVETSVPVVLRRHFGQAPFRLIACGKNKPPWHGGAQGEDRNAGRSSRRLLSLCTYPFTPPWTHGRDGRATVAAFSLTLRFSGYTVKRARAPGPRGFGVRLLLDGRLPSRVDFSRSNQKAPGKAGRSTSEQEIRREDLCRRKVSGRVINISGRGRHALHSQMGALGVVFGPWPDACPVFPAALR